MPVVVAAHDARRQVAVSAEVLGRAVDDDVGPVLQRSPEARGREGVVDDDANPPLLRHLDDPAAVRDDQKRVRDRLEVQEGRLYALEQVVKPVEIVPLLALRRMEPHDIDAPPSDQDVLNIVVRSAVQLAEE